MKVKVTQADIDNGTACNAENCPVALAVQRLFMAKKVVCGTTQISIDGDKRYLPYAVGRIIRGYDAGNTMRPFDFELI